MQDCSITSALAMEILNYFTKPSVYSQQINIVRLRKVPSYVGYTYMYNDLSHRLILCWATDRRRSLMSLELPKCCQSFSTLLLTVTEWTSIKKWITAKPTVFKLSDRKVAVCALHTYSTRSLLLAIIRLQTGFKSTVTLTRRYCCSLEIRYPLMSSALPDPIMNVI